MNLRNTRVYLVLNDPPHDESVRAKVRDAVYDAAMAPDKNSAFDTATRAFRHLPRDAFLAKLHSFGYDCLIAICDDQIIGFVGFQDRADGSRHSFAYRVPEHLQGNGIGLMLVHAFLETAYKAGITDVRIHGNNIRGELSDRNASRMRFLFESVILPGNLKLPFGVERGSDDGWVKILPKQPQPQHA